MVKSSHDSHLDLPILMYFTIPIERLSNVSCDSNYICGVTTGIYAGLKVPVTDDDESYIICHKGTNLPE